MVSPIDLVVAIACCLFAAVIQLSNGCDRREPWIFRAMSFTSIPACILAAYAVWMVMP